MADFYQLEDSSGNYQLEDGSGSYLLETDLPGILPSELDYSATRDIARRSKVTRAEVFNNLLLTALAPVSLIARVPLIQKVPAFKKRYINEEIVNLLTTTLASQQATPFIQQELSYFKSFKSKRIQDEGQNLLTNLYITPFGPGELDRFKSKVTKLVKDEVVPNLLLNTLAAVSNPQVQVELDRARVSLYRKAAEDIQNLTIALSQPTVTYEQRAAIIQSFARNKRTKEIEDTTNLLLTTLAGQVTNPPVQLELDRLRVKLRKVVNEPELNLLMTTLAQTIAPRYHNLPPRVLRNRLRRFAEEVTNFAIYNTTQPNPSVQLELDTPIKRQKKAKIQELPNLLTSVFQPPAVPQSQLEMDTPIRRQKKAKIHDIPNLITTTFQVPANPPVNQEGYSFKFKQLKKIIWDIPNLLNTTLAVIVGSGVAPTVKFTFTLTRQLSFDFNLQSDPAVVFQLNRQLSYTKEMVSSNG